MSKIVIKRDQLEEFCNEFFRSLATVAHDPTADVVMEWPPMDLDDDDDIPLGAVPSVAGAGLIFDDDD